MEFGEQVRAVRAAANLSRQEFGAFCNVSVPGLKDIEDAVSSPTERTRARILRGIESLGYKLTDAGIERRSEDFMIFDDYVDVLDDAKRVLKPGQEILFHRADDRRSVAAVIEKMKELEAAGIKARLTICEGNTYMLGRAEDYRWLPKDYYANGEVEAIYADRFVIHVKKGDTNVYFAIRSQHVADVHRKNFEYWWRNGQCPNTAT